jgi:alanine racemase
MRFTTFLEVNLGLLQENIQKIKDFSSARILPMVKADAYGNGLISISKTLVNECGLKTLGCASLGEAVSLFNQCPNLETEILVFSDSEITNPDWLRAYEDFAIVPVLHSKHDVEFVLKHPSLRKLPIVIKVNTGMNRLGLDLEELSDLAPKLKNRGVKHLMTHFAHSYSPIKPQDRTYRQMEEFVKAKKILSHAGVEVEETSVSNSGAIEQKFGVNETWVRPGLMIYGPSSLENQFIWKGHQISRFVTKIMKIFKVKKGTPLGYGAKVTGRDGLVAIIPVGYADLSVSTISGAELMINGFKAEFIARVNMDMSYLMFDVSVGDKIKVGDVVEIWNHDNRFISELANQMKTIPYHLMCAVTSRIPRIYRVK